MKKILYYNSVLKYGITSIKGDITHFKTTKILNELDIEYELSGSYSQEFTGISPVIMTNPNNITFCPINGNCSLKHKIIIPNKGIAGCGAVVVDSLKEDIVVGVPAKSIKKKLTTGKLFLMARQSTHNLDNKKEPVATH